MQSCGDGEVLWKGLLCLGPELFRGSNQRLDAHTFSLVQNSPSLNLAARGGVQEGKQDAESMGEERDRMTPHNMISF